MYGPCRSAIGGGQALTSTSRHRLGRPLPYQQADSPQALPEAHRVELETLLRRKIGDYRELVPLSRDYARLQGRFLRVTTSSATIRPKPDRLTCMPYPRRQRSS